MADINLKAGAGSLDLAGSAIDPVAVRYVHDLCLLLLLALEKAGAPPDVREAITQEGDIQPAHDWLVGAPAQTLQMAQVEAAEGIVMNSLRKRGLLPPNH